MSCTRLLHLLVALALVAPVAAGTAAGFNEALKSYQVSVATGQWDDAVAASTTLLDEAVGLLPDGDERWAVLYINHATALAQNDQRDDAVPWFEKAYATGRAVWGDDAPELIPFMKAEASAYISSWDSNPARKRFRVALDATAAHYGGDSLEYAALALDAGRAMIDKCFSVRGETWVEEALAIYDQSGDDYKAQAAIAAFYLGKHRLYRGDESIAIDYLERAVDTLGTATEETKELSAAAHAKLVSLYTDRGNASLAAEHQEAIASIGASMQQMDYLPVKRVAPRYPKISFNRGLEAYVDLVFTVATDGSVEDVVVTDVRVNLVSKGTSNARDSVDGRRFAEAAKRAVSEFEYTPRFVDGEPIAVPGVRTRIRFQMD